MGKISHLALKRQDSTLWSPLDTLKEMVRAIEAGETNPTGLTILFYEDRPGERHYGYLASNLTTPEHLALMDVAHNIALEEWKGG